MVACLYGFVGGELERKTAIDVSPMNKSGHNIGSTHVGEPLSASNMLALMRFLAGMCSNVDSQSTSLNKAFSTAGSSASIGSLICMDPVMSLQV
jgi:hypothetical protein